MPVQGIFNESDSPARGLPTLAVLHKGASKESSNGGMPPDLPYFRIEFKPQFAHLRPIWEQLYGKEPKEFANVLLTAGTSDQAFSFWKEQWSATTLLKRCDGVTVVRHWEPRTGKYSDEPQACAGAGCKCKMVGKLPLIFPEFVRKTGILGVITLNTTSLEDVITIDKALRSVETLWGNLASVPFTFGRAEREISTPNPKDPSTRLKVKKSLCYLYVAPEFAKTRLLGALEGENASALPSSGAPAGNAQQALPAPSDWRDAFCQWCADVFGVACEQVELALANYANGGEFNGTKEEAIAAVVLLVANYDLEQAIDLVKSKVPAQRVDAVLQIVTEYMNAVMAEAEFPE